ncbi:MAG: molybdopterin-dependent oxidoreductase [Candidatus Adiutrix sp.]|jgi:anaerobic selenocysteine-containing dehydrogenase|nr:molybdopterin-dependent oxidoreductase [Candidatus Adiutrix sp.]
MASNLDRLIKAKIPGDETGISIRHSLCDICTPVHHCGVDAYVKDGRVLKVEGTPDNPYNQGFLCTKGLCNRQYMYREDRLRTPLKRVGARGEGRFEPLGWDQAYAEIARGLGAVKEKYGPHAVAFFSGYAKWYRPIFQRFAFAFGSVNYGTDDSVCNNSGVMGLKCTVGRVAKPDLKNSRVFLGWAFGGYYSAHMAVRGLRGFKDRGGKVIIIDPKITPAVKHFADLHLMIKTGTDGALALGMARLIIDQGWVDRDYIRNHTCGYEDFTGLVRDFDLETTAGITGVPQELIYEATRLFATIKPGCINDSSSTVAHHANGFQNYRAIACLLALTGNFDVAGGNLPVLDTYIYRPAGFSMRAAHFAGELRPDYRHIGAGRFPIWDELVPEFQAVDLARHILEEKPYPVKALFTLGMNVKMFAGTDRMIEALKSLDFFVNTDLFETDTNKYADLVLPVCSSLERVDFKVYPGGYAFLTKAAVEPLYESKRDVDILFDLVKVLGIKDELLEKGYEACMDYMLEGSGLTMAELKKHDKPVKAPAFKPYVPGDYTREGYATPSGKFEFSSRLIAKYRQSHGLDPLPAYRSPFADEPDEEGRRKKYPLVLTTGTRLPNAIHSRLHGVPWARSLRPEPTADVNRHDAAARGVAEGDDIEIVTDYGRLKVKAHLTSKVGSGNVHFFHGYSEANANLLIGPHRVDPYSGFPAYKSNLCDFMKS